MEINPNDPEQLSTYEAEDAWANSDSKYNQHLDKKEAQRIADKLCRKFHKPKVEVVLTSTMAFQSYYVRLDQRIVLSRGWGQMTHVLLHELAHHISRCDGHDQDYRDTMLKIVAAFYSKRDAHSLRQEYIKRGLGVTPGKRGPL